jgi:hypothetical protein
LKAAVTEQGLHVANVSCEFEHGDGCGSPEIVRDESPGDSVFNAMLSEFDP